MNFQQRVTIDAPIDRLWGFVMSVTDVATCVPGVTAVEPVEGATDAYRGKLGVSVGPIKLTLEGNIAIEQQDEAAHLAVMRAEARDRRLGGGVNATMRLELTPATAGTDLVITTDATFLGKLGEFGQPVLRKKADGILADFAKNLQARMKAG